MSVRLPPPPRQHRHRHTSRGLSVDGSARDLSRLSLVLAAGQRELATAAINDAKRQRIEARQARQAQDAADELKRLVENHTLVWLVERQAQVVNEIAMYEAGMWSDEEVYKHNQAEAEQLDEAIRIKEGRKEQDAAIAAAAAAAEEEREAEEERKLAERVAANRQRKQEAAEAKERLEEAKKAAGKFPKRTQALEDPNRALEILKSDADRKWWNREGRRLAGRLVLAAHRERTLLDAWRRRRQADEAALAADPELQRRRARYEEILTIVTNLDDEDEKVRDAAWSAYVQIAPEEMEAFHAHNLALIAEEQEVEKEAEKAAKRSFNLESEARWQEVEKEKAKREAEEADQNDMGQIEKREDKRIRAEQQAKEDKKAEKDAERDQRRAAKEAEKRAAREKENASRPAGKRRAPQ